jgi:hypothetical protein
MVAHKFKLGELVEVAQTWIIPASAGLYEIVGVLPERDLVPRV